MNRSAWDVYAPLCGLIPGETEAGVLRHGTLGDRCYWAQDNWVQDHPLHFMRSVSVGLPS